MDLVPIAIWTQFCILLWAHEQSDFRILQVWWLHHKNTWFFLFRSIQLFCTNYYYFAQNACVFLLTLNRYTVIFHENCHEWVYNLKNFVFIVWDYSSGKRISGILSSLFIQFPSESVWEQGILSHFSDITWELFPGWFGMRTLTLSSILHFRATPSKIALIQ